MNFSHSLDSNLQFYYANWEQLFSQILFSYYQLSQNYRATVNKNIQLTEELRIKAQILSETEKQYAQNCPKVESNKTLPVESEIQKETIKEQEKIENVAKRFIKKQSKRKRKSKTSRKYKCCYPDCNRTYDSSVSLNLHIKLKHNGGTKKQRQTIAKMIIDTEEKGIKPPKININFPPNFLENQLSSYEKIQHMNSEARKVVK